MHIKTKEARKIKTVTSPDVIGNYYTFENKDGTGKGLTSAKPVASGGEAETGGEAESEVSFVARIVPKAKFATAVDANEPSEKLSEFDWLKTVESIFNFGPTGNLIQFHELLEDEDAYYLIMEKYKDADFMNSILYEKEIDEGDAKRIVRQLLTGLHTLHQQGMVHRDVQPENIRFRGQSFEKTELVLLPSEGVALHEPTSPKHKVVGEGDDKKVSVYHAPERLLGEFSSASDLWSVGVLMYILICGEPPFSEPCGDQDDMYNFLCNHKIDFDRDPWPEIPVARDLCQKLLTVDPASRTPSSAAALKHQWLNDDEPTSD
jgi:serine/threonine protein kinase